MAKASPNILEARSEKIERACRSSFRAELEALQATADLLEATCFQVEDICNSCDPETRLETYGDTQHARALIIDSKGLYNGLKNEKKPSPIGERGRLACWIMLRQSIVNLRVALHWVNSDHELADCLTKLREKCQSAHKAFRSLLDTNAFRICYDTASARRMHQMRLGPPPVDEAQWDHKDALLERYHAIKRSAKNFTTVRSKYSR